MIESVDTPGYRIGSLHWSKFSLRRIAVLVTIQAQWQVSPVSKVRLLVAVGLKFVLLRLSCKRHCESCHERPMGSCANFRTSAWAL